MTSPRTLLPDRALRIHSPPPWRAFITEARSRAGEGQEPSKTGRGQRKGTKLRSDPRVASLAGRGIAPLPSAPSPTAARAPAACAPAPFPTVPGEAYSSSSFSFRGSLLLKLPLFSQTQEPCPLCVVATPHPPTSARPRASSRCPHARRCVPPAASLRPCSPSAPTLARTATSTLLCAYECSRKSISAYGAMRRSPRRRQHSGASCRPSNSRSMTTNSAPLPRRTRPSRCAAASRSAASTARSSACPST